jgi:hypothetical protein
MAFANVYVTYHRLDIPSGDPAGVGLKGALINAEALGTTADGTFVVPPNTRAIMTVWSDTTIFFAYGPKSAAALAAGQKDLCPANVSLGIPTERVVGPGSTFSCAAA